MPTPDYRVPVRVARGTKAALDAGLTDLQEGELCYATDENGLYVIEGGVLTPTVPADLTGIEIVNDTSPQLGGDLDVNGFDIISVSGPVDIGSATGELVVRGGSSEGKLTLNCTANTHGVSIQSPPHASSATYTLTLPDDTGTDGQALTTDGSGNLSWATPSAVGSIDDLSDVDTTTNAPSTGQGLVWDGTQWAPGDVSDVDLATSSIDDLSDVDTTTTAPTNDQVLAWNGTNWVPADQTGGGGGGGVTSIIAGAGISVDQATGDVTVTATGGGGSSTIIAPFAFGHLNSTIAGTGVGVSWGAYDAGTGSVSVAFDTAQSDTSYIVVTDCESADDVGASVGSKSTTGFTLSFYDFSGGNPASPSVHPQTFQVFTSGGTQQVAGGGGGGGGSSAARLTEAQTAASGVATFTGIGHSGTLVEVTSSLDAWIVLYDSAASRTADNGRAYSTDPAPGSGVLAEFYIAAGTTVLATPGTTYFNNDTSVTEAVYAAVRDQAGADVNSGVTIVAYGNQTIDSVSGGTFGSGV